MIVNNWSLHRVHGEPENGIIGKQLRSLERNTSPITSYGKGFVMTANGTKYELGTPNIGFAVRNPSVIAELT
jgi:hypothetical protein